MTYTIYDRDGKEIASNEELYELAGEETQLWREEDGEGEFVYDESEMSEGDEKEYIWKRTDGTEVVVGTLVCDWSPTKMTRNEFWDEWHQARQDCVVYEPADFSEEEEDKLYWFSCSDGYLYEDSEQGLYALKIRREDDEWEMWVLKDEADEAVCY